MRCAPWEIKARGIRRIGSLATGSTADQEFYEDRLADRRGLEVLVPAEGNRHLVRDVVYDELCLGQVRDPFG